MFVVSLEGCQTVQIAVRPDVVIPETERNQMVVQLFQRVENQAPCLLFKYSKKAFHLPILPGRCHLGGLVFDVDKPQAEAKGFAGEDGFIIGSKKFGFLLGDLDDVGQGAQDGG